MANRNLYRLEMLLLKILEEEDCYGYQLSQALNKRSDGQIKIADGTMYPILYKLEDQGYISDYKKLVGKRQTRVYYHLEDAGKEHLAALIKDYYKLTSAIESIINPRM